jgi:hypothetical protein
MKVISIYARLDGGSECPYCGDSAASARRVTAAWCAAGRKFIALCATCRTSSANVFHATWARIRPQPPRKVRLKSRVRLVE